MMEFELTTPQDQAADFSQIQRELRPQAAINYSHELNSKFSFLSRFKVEWRFFQQADQFYDFRNVRLRMRMGLKYQLDKDEKYYEIKLEYIENLNEETQNYKFYLKTKYKF